MHFDQYNIRYLLLETDNKYYIFDRKSSILGYFFAPINAFTRKSAYELSSEQYRRLLIPIAERNKSLPSGLLSGTARLNAVIWGNLLVRQIVHYFETDYSQAVNLIFLLLSVLLSLMLIYFTNRRAKYRLEKDIQLDSLQYRELKVVPRINSQMIKVVLICVFMSLLMIVIMTIYVESGNLFLVILLPVLEFLVLMTGYFPYFEKMQIKTVKEC